VRNAASSNLAKPINYSVGFGPCLHLGPRGERCTRPALEDGVCELHGEHPVLPRWFDWARRFAALLLLLILLWIVLADFLREAGVFGP